MTNRQALATSLDGYFDLRFTPVCNTIFCFLVNKICEHEYIISYYMQLLCRKKLIITWKCSALGKKRKKKKSKTTLFNTLNWPVSPIPLAAAVIRVR